MADWIPLFVALPLTSAFLCLLLKGVAPRAAPWITMVDAVAVLTMGLVAAMGGGFGVSFLGGWGPVEAETGRFVGGIALVLDGLSAVFLLMAGVVSTAVAAYGFRYLDTYTELPLYYALFNLLLAGMCGAVLAGDLFNLFVFLEVASIASYALVAYGTGAAELEASFKYVLLSAVASASILLGIGVLYAGTGLLNMADLAVAAGSGAVERRLVLFASALFLCGFGLKAAMMPFHAWLPDAHPSAPAPISAMLSGLLIKTLGIYAIIRVFFTVVGVDGRIQTLLLVLGTVSMVAAVLLALRQDDLKRLLAYSSVSQMGYVLVALGLNTTLGMVAAVFHAMNHAVFKSALFLSSGSLERIARTRRLSEMGGLARRAPATTLGTMGASLSIAGVPPFNGFWSKLLVLVALFQAGQWAVGAVAAATAVLTLVTFVHVQRRALFGPIPPRLMDAHDVPAAMSVPVLVLAALCLVTFVLWPLGLDAVVEAAATAAHATDGGASPYVDLVLGRLP